MYTNILLKVKTFFANCVWHFHIHTRCVFLFENDVTYEHVLLRTCSSSCLVSTITLFVPITCALVSKWNEFMHVLEGHRFVQNS
jgi:hypothetical protein